MVEEMPHVLWLTKSCSTWIPLLILSECGTSKEKDSGGKLWTLILICPETLSVFDIMVITQDEELRHLGSKSSSVFAQLHE